MIATPVSFACMNVSLSTVSLATEGGNSKTKLSGNSPIVALLLLILLLQLPIPMAAQREKTTFQTSGQWKPTTDVRADAVMVYGVNGNRTASPR